MAGEWGTLRHGSIEKLEDNLWRVQGSLPNDPPMQRTMTVVRLARGGLIIHNAICLDEESMKELEAFGMPAFLIVPGSSHRIDAPFFKRRFPDLIVACPAGARKKVEQVVRVDTTAPDFGDANVKWRKLEGVGDAEVVLEVRKGADVTLVLNDAVMNMRPANGMMGLFFSIFGFTGSTPKVSGATKLLLVKNRAALRQSLLALADTPGLKRVIVAHGEVFTAEGLRDAAATL